MLQNVVVTKLGENAKQVDTKGSLLCQEKVQNVRIINRAQ